MGLIAVLREEAQAKRDLGRNEKFDTVFRAYNLGAADTATNIADHLELFFDALIANDVRRLGRES